MVDCEAQESARQISDTVTQLREQLEKKNALLDKAIAAIAELHASIEPPEDEISDPTLPIHALTQFVNTHAELLYEQHQLKQRLGLNSSYPFVVGD